MRGTYWLLLAEGHLNRRLFTAMLGQIVAAPGADGIEGAWTCQ
jgi:hypothetical protein